MFEKIIYTKKPGIVQTLFGGFDSNSIMIEKNFDVQLSVFENQVDIGDGIKIEGNDETNVNNASLVISHLCDMINLGTELSEQSIIYAINTIKSGEQLEGFTNDCICITTKGRPIKAKTIGQKKYIDAINHNTIVLGIGPAGTGKTFLAVAAASKALRNKEISRIILTRPAVEAGEKLGFLPGDLQSKINPYLRPLYDAMFEMLGAETYQRNLEKGIIEIAPLAYMRGRTLDDSFIILDEAQNTTPEQMKMFLTRLGNNSKAVVTGDLTQTDLPFGKKSGLAQACKILKGIEGIAIHEFTERDVVRHKLVQKIILAYDKYEKEHSNKENRFTIKDKKHDKE